ncbi:RNA polymerase sigma factor [Leifsonia lichenia]
MTQSIDTSYVEYRSDLRDDEELIGLVRGGGDAARRAYAELWKRHVPSALAAARRITTTFDAADLASEAFARVLSSLQAGKGPELSFRAYLVTTMRNVAALWARQEGRLAVQELDDMDAIPETAGLDRLDRLAGFEAFQSLPDRWRKVLWYSEVEDLNPTEIGALFGITSSAAAMLAFRARQGLRKAWLSSVEPDAQRSPARPTAAIGSAAMPNSRRSAERAAFQPHSP